MRFYCVEFKILTAIKDSKKDKKQLVFASWLSREGIQRSFKHFGLRCYESMKIEKIDSDPITEKELKALDK